MGWGGVGPTYRVGGAVSQSGKENKMKGLPPRAGACAKPLAFQPIGSQSGGRTLFLLGSTAALRSRGLQAAGGVQARDGGDPESGNLHPASSADPQASRESKYVLLDWAAHLVLSIIALLPS